jgi:hypothetical protein
MWGEAAAHAGGDGEVTEGRARGRRRRRERGQCTRAQQARRSEDRRAQGPLYRGGPRSNWQVHDPDQQHVDSTDDYLKQDPAIYHGPAVPELQDRYHLRVVPYTVDDEVTMQHVIDLGVDGIISDFPERLQLVAKRNGLK